MKKTTGLGLRQDAADSPLTKGVRGRTIHLTPFLRVACVWVGLGVAVGSACQSHKYPFADSISATASAQVKEGQVLYMEYCHKCHPDGEAGLGPSIYYLPGFAKRFQTRHGLGVMPDFDEKTISDQELDKIVAYLDALDD